MNGTRGEWQRRPDGSIGVMVRDHAGRPKAGEVVEIRSRGGGGVVARGVTSGDGRAVLSPTRPGRVSRAPGRAQLASMEATTSPRVTYVAPTQARPVPARNQDPDLHQLLTRGRSLGVSDETLGQLAAMWPSVDPAVRAMGIRWLATQLPSEARSGGAR